jgi:hypothetical protein
MENVNMFELECEFNEAQETESKVQRFKDFAAYLEEQGFEIKFTNYCDFEFHASSNCLVEGGLEEVFNTFCNKYSAVASLNNNKSELAQQRSGYKYYHTLLNSSTVDHSDYMRSLGGDGIAMVLGSY